MRIVKTLYDALHLDGLLPTVNEPSLADYTGKSFSKAVIASREYRESIVRRVKSDSLAPAVECRLLDHAYGKPVERIETVDKTQTFDHLSPEALEERALLLANVARRLRMNDAAKSSTEDTPAIH